MVPGKAYYSLSTCVFFQVFCRPNSSATMYIIVEYIFYILLMRFIDNTYEANLETVLPDFIERTSANSLRVCPICT